MGLSVDFLEVGCTHHLLNRVSKCSPRIKVSFPATVALLYHENYGHMLFDTGYSVHFHEATKKYPEKLYSMITPVELDEKEMLIVQLKQRGISPSDIKHIILSHFHADHIGGVKDFPTANFIYLEHAYSALKNLGRLRRLIRYGFLNQLLPTDFLQRSSAFTINWQNSSELFYGELIPVYDLFRDGSILAVDLPGHAPGHMGLIVHADNGVYFLIGDACWVEENLFSNSQPDWLVRQLVIYDVNQYNQTISMLRNFHAQNPHIIMVPCHCSKTHTHIHSQRIKKRHVP